MDGRPETSEHQAGADSVTVVIPVYNGAHFVGKAIDSVLAQTRPAAEILVINDGSTDNIVEVVGRYGDAVKLISQPNGGLSNARNTGIRLAHSRYIAFLDADDWWDPKKLEAQVAAMTADPGANANYTGLMRVDAVTGEERAYLPPSVRDVTRAVQWCNPAGPTGSSILVSKEMLDRVGPFKEHLPACEDWDMWFRLTRAGTKFTVTPEPLSYILVSSSSMSGDADHMYNTFLLMLDSLLKDMRGLRRWVWRRRILAYQAYKAVLTAKGAGRGDRERAYMWKSLAAWPSPFWTPFRFKVFAVTMLRGSSAAKQQESAVAQDKTKADATR